MTTSTIRDYAGTVTGVNRNQKNTGWAIQLKARQNRKYPDIFYVNDRESVSARVEGLKVGDYVTLVLAQGNLKDGKTGEYGAWDYWENVIDFTVSNQPAAFVVDVEGTTKSAVPVAGQPRDGGQEEFRRSKEEMRWTEAINNATNFIVNDRASFNTVELAKEAILYWATWYYQAIIAGPPSDDPQLVHEPIKQPSDAEILGFSEQENLAADPWAIIRASLEQYNADLKSGVRQGRVLQYERDVLSRVVYKFGGTLTLEQGASAAAAVAQGSIATWPTGGK